MFLYLSSLKEGFKINMCNRKSKFRKYVGQFSPMLMGLPEELLSIVVRTSPLEENKEAGQLPLFPVGHDFLRL